MEGVSRWSENGKAKALRHQVGVVLLANWAEEEEVEEESSVFCGPGTLPRPSFPCCMGETPDPRILQRVFTGCLHLWLCCDLIGGGTSFLYPSSDLYTCIFFFSLVFGWPQPQPLFPPAVCTLIDGSSVEILGLWGFD